MQKRQWKDAVYAFNKALANPLYQNPEKTYYNLGVAYYRLGQLEEADNALRNAIRRSPSALLPYYFLSLVLNKTGKYGEASATVARALELDPAYKGNREKFANDLKKRLESVRAEEAADLRDYIEILNY